MNTRRSPPILTFSAGLLGLCFTFLAPTGAECPNACSGHGSCGVFLMCQCYPNWMGSDCDDRVCPFGKSFMDSPKGDLDGSQHISSASSTVLVGSDIYHAGTQEEFPSMKDSIGTQLQQTGHEYAECSNVGICDRATGECKCFQGFAGSACSRTVCPNDCSGHGVCVSIKDMAKMSNALPLNIDTSYEGEEVLA